MVLSSAPFYSFVPLPPYILHKSFKYLVEKPQVSLLPHFDVTPPIESFEEDIQSPLKFGSSISALYPPFSFFDFTSRLQRFGETLFAAAIVISLIQAALALYQYRSNPSGELAFPPGLTCGVAYPTRLDSSDGSLIRKTSADTLKKNQSPFHQIHTFSEDSDRLLNEQHKDKQPSTYTRTLFKVNRMMVLLYPWIAQHIRAIVIKNAHIFHIFFIISLASAFNFWRSGPIGIDNGGKSSVIANLSDSTKKERKVIVIGDSLAVGIGSVEYFDENKNNTLPMFRVERLSHDDRTLNTALLDRNIDISPVFPRVFAQTLANRLEQRIRWRSAGVDGGDVSDIINFCSGVIEEESKFGHPPDVVVVICGINDLKKTVSNPFKSKSARGFRSSMEDMINEIRKHAPNASIIPSFTSTDVSQK